MRVGIRIPKRAVRTMAVVKFALAMKLALAILRERDMEREKEGGRERERERKRQTEEELCKKPGVCAAFKNTRYM